MTNTLHQKLGVSAATASRLRSGSRVGSPELILRVSELSGVDPGLCLQSAVSARAGEKDAWLKIIRSLDSTPEPEEKREEPRPLDLVEGCPDCGKDTIVEDVDEETGNASEPYCADPKCGWRN